MTRDNSIQSRRKFVRNTAAAGTLVGLSGLAGCTGDGDGGSSADSGGSGNSDGSDESSDGGSSSSSDSPLVYFMLPNQTTSRFENRDGPAFERAMGEFMPEAQVKMVNAQGDPTRQLNQTKTAISEGADLIVLIAADPNLSSGILEEANEADVPVISYEHRALDGPVTAAVLFDVFAVGEAQGKRAKTVINQLLETKETVNIVRVKGHQGQYGTTNYGKGQDEFIQPYIDRGEVEILTEQNITNWDPTEAQNFATDQLSRFGDDIDIFLCMNDGTASGAVAALRSQGYEPGEPGDDNHIVVTGGQDATAQGLQFILGKWQDNTVFKDLEAQGRTAAEMATALLKGNDLPDYVDESLNNGYEDIPAEFMPVTNVTEENVELVVEENSVWDWSDVCKGDAKAHPKCQ